MNLWNRSRDLRLKFFSWMHIIREDFNFFVVWSFFFLACKFFSHFFHSHRLWEMFEIFDYEILTIIKTIFTSIELVINSGNVLFKTIKKDMVCTYIFVKKKKNFDWIPFVNHIKNIYLCKGNLWCIHSQKETKTKKFEYRLLNSKFSWEKKPLDITKWSKYFCRL